MRERGPVPPASGPRGAPDAHDDAAGGTDARRRAPAAGDRHGPAAGEGVAVALRYDAGTAAPRVAAAGRGLVARNIEELAEQAGVPLYRDPELARLLASVDLGEEIPRALYLAVAELIAFVWSLREDP